MVALKTKFLIFDGFDRNKQDFRFLTVVVTALQPCCQCTGDIYSNENHILKLEKMT